MTARTTATSDRDERGDSDTDLSDERGDGDMSAEDTFPIVPSTY